MLHCIEVFLVLYHHNQGEAAKMFLKIVSNKIYEIHFQAFKRREVILLTLRCLESGLYNHVVNLKTTSKCF